MEKDLFPEHNLFIKCHLKESLSAFLLNEYWNKGIYGQYLLCYDEDKDVIYYAFTINDYSYIYFDAKTGEIIEEYYWNGDIED